MKEPAIMDVIHPLPRTFRPASAGMGVSAMKRKSRLHWLPRLDRARLRRGAWRIEWRMVPVCLVLLAVTLFYVGLYVLAVWAA